VDATDDLGRDTRVWSGRHHCQGHSAWDLSADAIVARDAAPVTYSFT